MPGIEKEKPGASRKKHRIRNGMHALLLMAASR
jgi:hypothetical protein